MRRLTIVGGVRERSVVKRRGRRERLCARGACPAWSSGPSSSPLACRAVPCYILAMKHISVADVIALPVAERLRLVEVIWDSIAEVPEQLELSPAQAQELDRRLAAFEKDPTQGSPWQEVRARLERTG